MTGLEDLRRALARRRVLLASGLAAAAVAAALSALAPPAEPGVEVLTAAHDLVAGVPLDRDDLVTTSLPAGLVPSGALVDAAATVGRLVVGPVRRGEPLTDVRLLGASLLVGDDVAVPVRVTEPATAALVGAGDRVDVLAASPEGGTVASVVATGLPVLSVPALGDDVGEGALLVLATDRPTAARLAAAAVTGRLSVVVGAP